jgi:hypothetical protein
MSFSKRLISGIALFLCTLPCFAAKQIIVLGQQQTGTQIVINVVFWYPITSGALAQTKGSLWVGASAAENTAIQNGTVLEESQSFDFPVGTTATTIKDVLNKAWTQRNTALGGVGPNMFNGIFFDSVSGWSA